MPELIPLSFTCDNGFPHKYIFEIPRLCHKTYQHNFCTRKNHKENNCFEIIDNLKNSILNK